MVPPKLTIVLLGAPVFLHCRVGDNLWHVCYGLDAILGKVHAVLAEALFTLFFVWFGMLPNVLGELEVKPSIQ